MPRRQEPDAQWRAGAMPMIRLRRAALPHIAEQLALF
jgi:hypothetical protein